MPREGIKFSFFDEFVTKMREEPILARIFVEYFRKEKNEFLDSLSKKGYNKSLYLSA